MATTGTINATSDPLTNQYVYLSPGKLFEHQPTVRMDYNVTDNHRLSGSFAMIWAQRDPDYLNSADARFPGAPNYRLVVCDPHDPAFPIVFANRAFCNLTGYSEEEVVGRNCRFLQGPDTDQAQIEKIRTALASEDLVVVELLNYRKDGTPFWNALHIGPIYDAAGNLVYYFGSQWDVSDVRAARAEEHYAREMARELSHRMKNMFAVISGIVNLTTKRPPPEPVPIPPARAAGNARRWPDGYRA